MHLVKVAEPQDALEAVPCGPGVEDLHHLWPEALHELVGVHSQARVSQDLAHAERDLLDLPDQSRCRSAGFSPARERGCTAARNAAEQVLRLAGPDSMPHLCRHRSSSLVGVVEGDRQRWGLL